MNDYKCALCGELVEWTTDNNLEALVEMHNNFGYLPHKDRMTICDDCYLANWTKNGKFLKAKDIKV